MAPLHFVRGKKIEIDKRNERGQFIKGHCHPGPGNPFLTKVTALRAALYDAVTPQDILDVIQKVLAQAKKGCVKSQQLFLDRCLGKMEINIQNNVQLQKITTTPDQIRFLDEATIGTFVAKEDDELSSS